MKKSTKQLFWAGYLLLLLFSSTPCLLAQETGLDVTYGDYLNLKNKRRGVSFALKNDYIFDFGGVVPTFNREELKQHSGGSVVTYPGTAKFILLCTAFDVKFGDKWNLFAQLDFSSHKMLYKSVQLDYNLNPASFIRVGNMRVPGPMSRNYAATDFNQAMPPLGSSLSSDRRLGVGYYNFTPRRYIAVGLYTLGLNKASLQGIPKLPEVGVATRFGGNLVHKSDTKLFLAGNLYWMYLADSNDSLSLRGSKGTPINTHNFIALDLKNVVDQLNVGLELGFQHRRLLLVGEVLASLYRIHEYSAPDGSSETPKLNAHAPLFFGWNANISYMIYGNPRKYNAKNGDFSGNPYQRGRGAMEVGLLFSGLTLDYNQDNTQYNGGQGISLTTYLTAWLNQHIAVGVIGSYVNHSATALGGGKYMSGEKSFNGPDMLQLQGRIQVSF